MTTSHALPDRAELRRRHRAENAKPTPATSFGASRQQRRASGQHNSPKRFVKVAGTARMTAVQRRSRNLRRLNARLSFARCELCRQQRIWTPPYSGVCASCTETIEWREMQRVTFTRAVAGSDS